MTSVPPIRRCCCSSPEILSSCACSSVTEDDCEFTEDGEDYQNPVFPSTIDVSYQRWSLGAECVAGYAEGDYGNIHATDEDVCTNSESTELVGCEYCSDCVDWDPRKIAADEIDVNTVNITCAMSLQTGEEPCDGRYADDAAVCAASYRGTILEGGSSHASSSMFGCPCGEYPNGGSSYDWPGQRACWRATLELQKETVDGEDYAVVYMELDVGLIEPDAAVDCDCNDMESYFDGGFRDGSPMVFRTAAGTGESLDGKCGYCYFPWQAFNNMELVSGGDVYPGAPPDSRGSETVVRSYGDTGVSWGHGAPGSLFDHLGCNITCCYGASYPYGMWISYEDAIPIQLDESWTIRYWADDDLDTWYASNPTVYLPLPSGTCTSSPSSPVSGCLIAASCTANDTWRSPKDGSWIDDCCPGNDFPDCDGGECTAWQDETTECTGPSGSGSKGHQQYMEGAFHRLSVSISSSG